MSASGIKGWSDRGSTNNDAVEGFFMFPQLYPTFQFDPRWDIQLKFMNNRFNSFG